MRKNRDMAYYNPRKPPTSPESAPDVPSFPGPVDIWDTMKAPLAGLWEGLVGKNRNYEQYVREKMRRRQGQVPGQYPARGVRGGLGRPLTGR